MGFAASSGCASSESPRSSSAARPTPPRSGSAGGPCLLAKFKPLRSNVKHIIEANVGAVGVTPKTHPENIEGLLERAFAAGQGQVVVELPEATQPELRGPFGPRLDSTLHCVDPDLPTCFFRPSAHLLSFNAPEHPESGACRTCLGLGRATTLDEMVLVAHPERSMHEGAFSLWTAKNYKYVNIQHDDDRGAPRHARLLARHRMEEAPRGRAPADPRRRRCRARHRHGAEDRPEDERAPPLRGVPPRGPRSGREGQQNLGEPCVPRVRGAMPRLPRHALVLSGACAPARRRRVFIIFSPSPSSTS